MAFANFSLTTAYTAIITALNAQLTAAAALFKDQTVGDFTGQVRVSSAGKRLESWNGSAWVAVDLSLTAIAAASIQAGTITATLNGAASSVPYSGLTGAVPIWNQNTTGSAANCTAYTAADVLTKIKTVDGGGSGLDADLFDGLESTAFAMVSSFASSLAANGYQKLPGGLTIQWGSYTSTLDTDQAFTFPIPFAVSCAVVMTNYPVAGTQVALPVVSKNSTTFTINRSDTIDGSPTFTMLAIGY